MFCGFRRREAGSGGLTVDPELRQSPGVNRPQAFVERSQQVIAPIPVEEWEAAFLGDEVQNKVKELWPQVTTENLFELTDYQGYKDEFLKLFGFGVTGIDYNEDIDTIVDFQPITL